MWSYLNHVIKRLAGLLLPLVLMSCIRDGASECAVYLEFIFDHNMDYADSFGSEVTGMDVYVFDEEGLFLFSRHADREELDGGNRLPLHGHLKLGTYRIITVGPLCDHFLVTDLTGGELVPGVTTIREFRLALAGNYSEVSHQFPHLWFGETVAVTYSPEVSVWRVPLVRNTNRFNVSLSRYEGTGTGRSGEPATYTFRIITPESGSYGYDNEPLTSVELVYRPYREGGGSEPATMFEAEINTMRLCHDSGAYTLAVLDGETVEEVWRYDLMELLMETKPSCRPDGSQLPFREYLDRQGRWDIVVMYKDAPSGGEAFVAVGIEVNGWMLWLRDIGI